MVVSQPFVCLTLEFVEAVVDIRGVFKELASGQRVEFPPSSSLYPSGNLGFPMQRISSQL
jgi:hypothetical protein